MAAATVYPYDDTTPRRPSKADLGGDEMIDDPKNPPGPGEPCADAWDHFVRLHAAACAHLPTASVTINFAAGVPFIEYLSSMGNNVSVADFSLTDHTVGQTTITWAAGTLPEISRPPKAHSHMGRTTVAAFVVTALSVRVHTYLDDSSGADAPVTVDIY